MLPDRTRPRPAPSANTARSRPWVAATSSACSAPRRSPRRCRSDRVAVAQARAARAEKQAEAEPLVFELFASMDADQKKKLVLPWDTAGKRQVPGPPHDRTTRPVGKSVIGLEYNKKQVELLDRIFQSIGNGEEGYKRLSRNGKFDNSGDFESIGALIYGEPVAGQEVLARVRRAPPDGPLRRQLGGGDRVRRPAVLRPQPQRLRHHQRLLQPDEGAPTRCSRRSTTTRRRSAVKPGKWKDEHGMVKPPARTTRLPGLGLRRHDQGPEGAGREGDEGTASRRTARRTATR